jgi:hypothetical protein
VHGERVAEQEAMVGEELAVALGAERMEQARRALDVREEHRHRAGGHGGPAHFTHSWPSSVPSAGLYW